jgi:bacteriocin biosynthesis cyclodehydratase domain-containing protein
VASGVVSTYRIRPYYQFVARGEREAILHGRHRPSLRIATKHLCPQRVFDALSRGLDGGAPDATLAPTAEAQAELAVVLQSLTSAGALCAVVDDDQLSPERRDRFSRLLNYYAGVDRPDHTRHDCLRRLETARVMVLGVGSLGSWALQHLVASGVGNLVLVDRDVVESSNLARQCFYLERHVGSSKVEAAAEVCRSLSSFSHVEPVHRDLVDQAAIATLLAEHAPLDLVVLTADMPMWKIAPWTAAACRDANVPLLRGNSLGIGPLTIPDETACPACAWPRLLDEIPDADERIAELRANPSRRPAAAAISTTIARMGAELAEEALRFLTGLPEARTRDAQLVATARGFEQRPFPRDPRCPVCGTQPLAACV